MDREAAIGLIEKGLEILKSLEKPPYEFEHPPKPKPVVNEVHRHYLELFNTAKIRPEYKALVKQECDKIKLNIERYKIASNESNVPWFVIACIHSLESSLSFKGHLHNGDPLSAKTKHVPAGRPAGNPPFTWEQSASDALKMKSDIYKNFNWGVEECLYFLERYNGMGYRNKGVLSPYLWSYTDKYLKGKYVADGKYDPNAISKQAGAAALLIELGVFNQNPVII